MSKNIVIGCDHAGLNLKKDLIDYLTQNGYSVNDIGCYTTESVDYPDIAKTVCDIVNTTDSKGVLICGTGIGISISANKIKGIRAGLCHDYFSAKYTRLHNDANVICLGARVIGSGLAIELVDIFMNTEFEGGRHQQRIDKLNNLQ